MIHRDQHVLEYVNADKSHTVETHVNPVSWEDSAGEWRAFDTSISRTGSGAVETGSGMPFRALFDAGGYSWAPDVTAPSRNIHMNFLWVPDTSDWSITDAKDGKLQFQSGATTTVLHVINSGVKASMLLADDTAPMTWTIRVATAGELTINKDDLTLLDGFSPVGRIVPPTAVDAAGISRELTWTWTGNDLVLTLDPSDLTFPIDVDPTVTYTAIGSNDVQVTGTFSYPNFTCSSASTTATTARLGFTTPYSNMMFLHFPSVAIPRGAIVDPATNVQIWEVGSPSQAGSDEMIWFPNALYTDTSGNSPGWSSCPDLATRTFTWGTPNGVSGGGSNQWKVWNVTGSVTKVTDRIDWTSSNALTFMAGIGDHGTGTYYSTYGLSELGSRDPKLIVTYTPDTTAPTPPTVRDWAFPWVVGTDYDYTTIQTIAYMDWTGGSDNYKVRGMQMCFTKSSTGSDCASTATSERSPWSTPSPFPASGATGLMMVDGTKYYMCGRMEDYAGNLSTISCSDGITFDVSVPTPTSVNDGSGTDIDYQSSTTTINANWAAVVDPGSGTDHYQYCISRAANCGGAVIKNWTTVTGTTVTAASLSLTTGLTYYVSVRAYDTLGNVSSSRSSDGVMVTSPSITVSTSTADISEILTLDENQFSSFTVKVDTRAANGYQLFVRDGSATGPACVLCGGISIPDWTASVTAPAEWPTANIGAGITVRDATTTGGRLAKWGAGTGTLEQDISALNKYGGLAVSDQLLHERTEYSALEDTITATYRVHAAAGQQAGLYTAALTFTATASL